MAFPPLSWLLNIYPLSPSVKCCDNVMVLWILSALFYSIYSYVIVGTNYNKDDMFGSEGAEHNCSAIGEEYVVPASQIH